MAEYQLIIIGAGLSGLAAGIRAARFGKKTLILEQHALPGGLNSYYLRQGRLFETGLHAMTNFAATGDKRAPLNRLFRQLQLSRKNFEFHEQIGSEIRFHGRTLRFSNDPVLLAEEIQREFPERIDHFQALRAAIVNIDPFAEGPWTSARAFLHAHLQKPELEDMLLLPLMLYGNAEERDMDLRQFTIMFRAIFEDGFFRPNGTIRDFIDLLIRHYQHFGGELRYRAPVAAIMRDHDQVLGVRLGDGTEISAEAVLSTVGMPETIRLSGWPIDPQEYHGRMSFMETIVLLPQERVKKLHNRRTIIFYHEGEQLAYTRPKKPVDSSWGVICFPENFHGISPTDLGQIRLTNAASYPLWQDILASSNEKYQAAKKHHAAMAIAASGKIIGNYQEDIVYQDSFTPLTIARFTRKAEGAVYGSPIKLRDGRTPWHNLFVAGTDQGYLGIVGAMLSGIVIVNQHVLP